jgi:hypothetical protein
MAGKIDWPAISAYLGEVSKARRIPRESNAPSSVKKIGPDKVRAFRARSSHLDSRLGAGSFADAAWGGLQDSAPRSALLSLHARVKDVTPDSWSDREVAQIWFRWADYLVPRSDVDVFTIGALPRNALYAGALDALGRAIEDVLDGEGRSPSEVASKLRGIPSHLFIRAGIVTGRFHIRWDARTVILIPAKPPRGDPEDARLELARRFLHWLGPGSSHTFARWAGVARNDAEQTWSSLEKEIAPVSVDGWERSALESDVKSIGAAEPPSVVRFLPQGDPFLASDKLVPQAEPKLELPDLPRREVNALTGRVLADGNLVASWSRRQNRITIAPWHPLNKEVRDLIQGEAESFRGPIGKPMDVRWIDPE